MKTPNMEKQSEVKQKYKMNETDNSEQQSHQLLIPNREDNESATVSYDGNPIKEKMMAMLGAIAATGLVAMTAFISINNVDTETPNVTPLILESIPKPPDTKNPYYSLSLEARAAVVYDVHNDKILFEINKNKPLPLASLTKMMTALVASETFDTNTNIAIAPKAIETEGDSGLFSNESWKIKDLISFTMLTSSNDGASALAAAAGSLWYSSTPQTMQGRHDEVDTFVDKMNLRAREIGLQETTYTNPTGLDNHGTGGLGTAEDMSKLLTYIWENEPGAIQNTNILEKEFVSEDNFVHFAENTNEHVRNIPGLIGSKTGYTDKAGGNLAVIYDSGMDHPIVIVVLGSSIDGRFEDVQDLVDATYGYIASGWFEYEITGGSTPSRV